MAQEAQARIKIAKALSLLISLAGMVVMIGWVFSIPALTSIRTEWINMKLSTAVCFLLSGIMLYFIFEAIEGEFDKAQVVIFITSLTILLFMGTLFFSVFFKVHTGIEELFIKDTGVSVKTLVPGQPAIPTMISFMLICLAGILTILGIKNVRPKLKFIGFIVGMIGLSAVVGYIINASILYYYVEGLSSAMAFHTAILFVLSGAGLLCL